jgi:hypothetical protein
MSFEEWHSRMTIKRLHGNSALAIDLSVSTVSRRLEFELTEVSSVSSHGYSALLNRGYSTLALRSKTPDPGIG